MAIAKVIQHLIKKISKDYTKSLIHNNYLRGKVPVPKKALHLNSLELSFFRFEIIEQDHFLNLKQFLSNLIFTRTCTLFYFTAINLFINIIFILAEMKRRIL